MLQLYIANKNYSSWSMRPWVLLRQAGIAFEEVYVRFDSFAPDSQFKATLKGVNPVGKVPVLVHDSPLSPLFMLWTPAETSLWAPPHPSQSVLPLEL